MPQTINGEMVEGETSFKFLGTYTSKYLTGNTSALVKKAKQSLHFQRELQRNHLEVKTPGELLLFYHREYVDVLCHSLVCSLFSHRYEAPAEGYHNSREDHWLPPVSFWTLPAPPT